MTRDYVLKTRLTGSERDVIEGLAAKAGVSMADYVRMSVFGPRHMRKLPGAEQLVEARHQLARIAKNVNQIAKAVDAANAAGTLDSALIEKSLRTLAQLYLEYKQAARGVSEFMVAFEHG